LKRLLPFGDAWNRGDVDEILSCFAAEGTYHASAGLEPGRTYQGREAARRGVIGMLAFDRGGRFKTEPAFVADDPTWRNWCALQDSNLRPPGS
jgi:ketosteroid isomerase-like protein